MPRHIIVGDVHGMFNELWKLFGILVKPDDKVVFVGDLVDKGPDSARVVQFVREMSRTHDITLVEGNHEEKHRRFRKNCVERPDTAKAMSEHSPELQEITEQLTDEDIEFLNTAVPFHRIEEHNILVVHGGIPGSMTDFPQTVEEAQSLGGKRKKKFSQILRTRHIHHETGKMLPLGNEGPNDPFWAETHDGRFGHVVFGHEPFLNGVAHFENATGIDTGAVFGGRLTAMVVEENGSREFVSVPSRKMTDPLHC
jgi:diadenosine tetraphosphatase ApaH/serine/threonine PP2A family protein phosphatase